MDGLNQAAGISNPDNGGATGSGIAPNQGSFGGRRVSTSSGEDSPAPSPVKRRGESPEAGPSAEARRMVPLSKRALPAPQSVPANQAALPGPAMSSTEPPSRATATAGTVGVAQKPGTAAEREPLPRRVDLPWLNSSRNAALPTAHSRLRALLEHRDLPEEVKKHLSKGFEIMTRTEPQIVRVAALLQRTALEDLTLAERTELERLVLSIRNDLATSYGVEKLLQDWNAGLVRIAYGGSWDDTVRGAARDLIERYAKAREYFYSAEVPWEPAIRRLAIMKAAQAEVPITVVRDNYPWELPGSQPWPGVCPALPHARCLVRAPDCTHTAMTDANGRPLYTGISHSLFQHRLTEEEAAIAGYADRHGLSFERVHAEVERLYSLPGGPDLRLDLELVDLDDRFNVQGASDGFTDLGELAPRGFGLANAAVRSGADRIAEAVVAQALYSDPEKTARAFSGETVDIKLMAIPILHCSDTSDCMPQLGAFEELEESPLALSMLDHKGHAHNVPANVRYYEHAVTIGEFRARQARSLDATELCKLIGPLGDRELSGEVSVRIDAMKTRVAELRSSMIRELPSIRPAGKPLPEVGPVPNELRKLGEDSAYLERNLRTLEQAGMDLKAYLMGGLGIDAGDEPILDNAARVALVAHLTGRTPVLCCPADKDSVIRVESHIESLLSFAGAHEGNLPILLARAVR